MIPLIAFLGLVAYYIYQMIRFDGNIIDYFKNKKNVLHMLFSFVTMVILLLSVEWSTIETYIQVAGISFSYAYILAALIGWSNGSIFMAAMNLLKHKKAK